MPFPSALTTDQYNTLRGSVDARPSYAASEYAIFCPNTVIFKALVNGAPSGTSFAQVTFDNVTTGAYTDIVVGQTVLIGSDSNIRNATFLGRVRKTPTSSILYIQETSESILDNANIWVIDDFRVWDRLARVSGSTQLKDYDIAFSTPAPLIYGLQSAYAGIASGSPEVLELSFAPSALPITSGATIDDDTWLWTVPSGMTITVGTDTDQNITAEFDAGFAGWVSVQVDDSNGKTGVFHFFVGAAASDLSNVINLNIVPGGLQGDDNGWTCGVEAFAGIDTMLDNTLVVLFDVEYYNTTETSILSNVKFVGRIRKETNNTTADELYSQLKKASLDIEGTLAQFGRIEHLPFTLINKASPTQFDEVKDLTLWRAIAYTLYWHSTYLTLHSLTFDNTDTTFLYLGIPTQGGNILSVIQDIAVSNNATIESAPQGETRVYRNGVYLTGAQRAALTTVADFTMQDLINIDSLDISEVDITGKIQGSGGFYNSTSGKVTPLLSLAPGIAQGIGDGISTFGRQVLQANVTQATAQSELNTRTGHEFAAKRDEGIYLSVSLPPGYHWLTPSRSQWYTWTIATSDNTGGRAFTTSDRWQLFSVSYQHDNTTGTKSAIQATFKLETSGTPGQTVVYPPITQIPPTLPTIPTIPPFPTIPPLPDISLPTVPTPEDAPPYPSTPVAANGNLIATWSTTQLWIATDTFLTSSPSWVEITPTTSLGIIQSFQWIGLGNLGAYLLTMDGENSRVHYTPDATQPGAVWTDTDVTGVYERIRVGSTQGQVYVLGQSDTESCTGWTDLQFGTTYDGEFGGKQRFTCGAPGEGVGDGVSRIGIVFAVDDCCNFISIDLVAGTPTSSGFANWIYCGDPIDFDHLNTSDSFPLPLNVDYIAMKNLTGTSFTVDLELVSAGGSVVTRYSSDYGANFASPETAGDPP